MSDHESEEEHLKKHQGRTETSNRRHEKTEIRADINEVRLDVGEDEIAKNTAGRLLSQEKQEATDRITTEHTKKIREAQNTQIESNRNLDKVVDGVNLLINQVTTLNTRVYTKNYLDKIRNWLIFSFTITFLFVSFLLGSILIKQNISDENRAKDARTGRLQIADCTVKPGTILEDNYVNPGKCYNEGLVRTGQAIEKLTNDILTEIKKLLTSS